ncbi:MAG: hypothetical protein M1830_010701 [Pleopsidium flavum]|nr:MAG: hypothetical protein M1830_010701 [Pleopsidium flavum]
MKSPELGNLESPEGSDSSDDDADEEAEGKRSDSKLRITGNWVMRLKATDGMATEAVSANELPISPELGN